MKETRVVATPMEAMVRIPESEFLMGSDHHYPEEAPAHRVSVRAFRIDPYAVTNAQFAQFVEETGHVTFVELPVRAEDYPGALPDMLDAGSVVFRSPSVPVDMRNPYGWWAYVKGACWRHPYGPGSSLEGLWDHPVVHVAYADAAAYAGWAGKQLPSEAEWELAARGGLDGADYAWGDEQTPGGAYLANWWQGGFPHENSVLDGHERTAPVGSYPPNGYGLYDMIGNVWEWTSDWYEAQRPVRGCCAVHDPRGGTLENSIDPRMPNIPIPRRVMKGGSFLCAASYCHRYRPAARMPQPIDTATCHLGFRCVVRDD
ncbi:MAG: putative sulfatase-modifying factor [Myxococcales bacterium]|nr:putative sulfatase-modifying factor [Myxococcales bacterium]